MIARLRPLLLAALLAGCAVLPRPSVAPRLASPLERPAGAQTGWRAIAVTGTPADLPIVHLAPGVRGAGAIVPATADTDQFHGLSDVKVAPDGRLVIVTDEGWLASLRPVVAPDGTLRGVAEARIRPLLDGQGARLEDYPREPQEDHYNSWSDSEGIGLLPGGGLLVSFEHHQRLWLYDRWDDDQGRARAIAGPPPTVDSNNSFETVASLGRTRWVVAAEAGGWWLCGPRACHEAIAPVEPPLADPTPRVVSADVVAGLGMLVLERGYEKDVGTTVRLWLWRFSGTDVAHARRIRLVEVSGATGPNFEGVAGMRTPAGWRVWLVSDDNFNARQRMVLAAFDLDPTAFR